MRQATSSFIDALKSLGVQDNDEENHVNAVRSQIQEVLADQDDPENAQLRVLHMVLTV